jgi:hypothetical protein
MGFPDASYLTDSSRTEGEFKAALEAFLAAAKQLPGGQAETELTISAGSVTPTRAAHSVDTEADAATDDLDAIALALPEGALLFLRGASTARVVTVRHAAGGLGQIILNGAEDLALDDAALTLILQRAGDTWREVGRLQSADNNTDYVESLLDSSPSSDHTVSGLKCTRTAGESLAFGDLCYLKSDGKMWKADASASATLPAVAICAASISADASGEFLLIGFVRDDSWSFSPGDIIHPSETPGVITSTQPSTSGSVVQRIGYAVSSTVLWFNPGDMTMLEVA